MATRSHIGILNDDNTVTYVYCHFDGYPEYVGKILKEHYNTEDKVRELLSFGHISVLDINIHPTDPSHSFDNRTENTCLFYGRDRGDNNYDAETISLEKYKYNEYINYIYLFKNNKWQYKIAYHKTDINKDIK